MSVTLAHKPLWKGLNILARVREDTGMPIITEVMDESTFDLVEAYADIIHIGTRNMQNFSLLKRAGRSVKPVFLKRGLAATIDEWLMAAEYILEGGNSQVMLCMPKTVIFRVPLIDH